MDIVLDNSFIEKYTPSEQIVFLHLLLSADRNGIVLVSVRALCKEVGMSYQTCRTTLRKLIGRKVINAVSNAGNNASANAKKTTLSISKYEGYAISSNAGTNAIDNAENNAMFEEVWAAYNRKGSKKKSLVQWQKLSDEDKKMVLPHVRAYVGSRDRTYQKDFERYLRDKVFKDAVVSHNDTIYDPEQFADSDEYRPMTDGVFLVWSENRKCVLFNGYIEQLNDGYTSDSRPDGARAASGLYEWVWSRKKKEWVKQNE